MPQAQSIPGSGGNNAGYAVVYPDNDLQRMQIANSMHQANLAQQQRLQQQQQEEAAHKYALSKYYGGQFDFDKFDTGTDLDKSINDLLIDGKNKLADVLSQKGISDEDVDRAANEALIPAMRLSVIGKTVKRNIDGTVAGYDKKDVDTGSLSKHAYIKALYNRDPNSGKLTLKNTDELNQIDPDFNYAEDIVKNQPGLVSKGNIDVMGSLKNWASQPVGDSGEYYDSQGIKHKGSWKTNIYTGLQQVEKDAKGVARVVTVNNPIPITDEKGNPVIDPNTGKQAIINQAPDALMNHLQDTPGKKAAYDVATINYLKSHPATANESAIPGTPGFEIAKRAMVYDQMQNLTKRVNFSQGEQAPSFVIKNMLGIPGGGTSGSQTPAQQNNSTPASFSDITNVRFTGNNGGEGQIQNGKLVGFKGGIRSLFNGGVVEGTIPVEQVPLSIRDAVAKYSPKNDITGDKYKDTKSPGYVDVKIKNGQVAGIRTDSGQWFDLNNLEQTQINDENKVLSMKNKIQPKQNTNQYYNDPDNVLKQTGDKVTYRDGTIWQIQGGKFKKIK